MPNNKTRSVLLGTLGDHAAPVTVVSGRAIFGKVEANSPNVVSLSWNRSPIQSSASHPLAIGHLSKSNASNRKSMGDLSENGCAEPFRIGHLSNRRPVLSDSNRCTYQNSVVAINPE